MTLYRRWPDTQTLLADLMTREWGQVVQGGRPRRRRHPRPDRQRHRRDRPGAAGQRAAAPDRRRRPRGAAPLPARPPRSQPGDGRRRARRADRPGPAREVDPARRPRRARTQPGARLPRVHPVGAHHVRPHGDRRAGTPTSPTSTPSSTNWCGGTSPDDHQHRTDQRRPRRHPRVHRRPGHRPRHHRRRGRPRRRQPRALGGGGRRPRRRLRHQPVELQAGARRAALPRPAARSTWPTRAPSSAAS